MEEKEYFGYYSKFVDSVASDISKNDKLFNERMQELSQKLGGNYSRLDNAISGLAGEAGEVADVWKKVKYHNMDYNGETKELFIKELGDVCWYLFLTAMALNVSFEEIINRNIEKLRKRHPHGFSDVYMVEKKR